jgi:Asp/Glu/hydantoin racemase
VFVNATTPIHVGPQELTRRQQRYDRLAPPGLAVRLHDLPADAPAALETAADIERSERFVPAAMAAVPLGDFAAALPDCVLEPGAGPDGAELSMPLHGILRLTCGFLAGAGAPFGAVARNPAIAAELTRKVVAYGFARSFVGAVVLDLDVGAIADPVLWNAALTAAVRGLAAAGAAAVVNGCSAVDVSAADLPAAVVDPTELALGLLGTGAGRRVLAGIPG